SDANREHIAHRLFLHHLPVVAAALSRYCAGSGCDPGRCPVRELVGETYPLFLSALDRYEPGTATSFAEHLRRELDHGLRRRFEAIWTEDRASSAWAELPSQDVREMEATLLEGRFTEELLGQLDPDEIGLLLARAMGSSIRELAESR
ncbi:MAG: hypothetical protein GWN71_08855, partial [Gammaproteobacteria bacterium]|nr:hypothetical protein [Gemmatimonadota bacterium]NIU73672.1 hypothetical protein [Gammaproteobacteria bacterium]NIX23776.1 hypothetical protein [Actinomycetota bacterium]